jgi:hypothetical protein
MDNIDELKADAEKAYQLGDKELALNIYKKLDSLSQPEIKPDFSSSPMGRFLTGAQSAGESVAQAAAHALPENAQISVPSVSFSGGKPSFEMATVNPKEYLDYGKKLHEEQAIRNEKAGIGGQNGGYDVAGIAGSFINPVAGISKNPVVAGVLGGLIQPVDSDNYLAAKTGQAVAGGVIGGALGKVGEIIGNKLSRKVAPESKEIQGARASIATDEAIDSVLKEVEGAKLSENQKDTLRQEILNTIKSGQTPDAAALLRKQQFESLGMKPMKGEITRDPNLWSQQQNIRGAIQGVSDRLRSHQEKLAEHLKGYSKGAIDSYNSGKIITNALEDWNQKEKSRIGELYKNAKDETGRYANVDAYQFSQAANSALDENMMGHYLPDETRNLLNDISSEKIPLNVNNLVQIDTVLSAAQRKEGTGSPSALAIGHVRDALHNADIDTAAGEEAKAAFDLARGEAAKRFKTIRENPALDDVVSGKAINDTFIKKHFLNNPNTDQINRTAELLRNVSPDAFNTVKAKIGQDIERAAFGLNEAAKSEFKPEALAKALEKYNPEKLSAFFSPDEIEKLQTISNVGSYVFKPPPLNTKNASNTFVAAMQNSPLIQQAIKMTGPAGKVVSGAAHYVPKLMEAGKASEMLAGEVPMQANKLTAQQQAIVDALRQASGVTGGMVGGQSFNN